MSYLSAHRFIRISGVPGGGVFGIVGDGTRGVWISHGTKGLVHVVLGEPLQQTPWSQLGRNGSGARASLASAFDGGVWLGFFEGGMIYFKDNQIQISYTSAEGLGKDRVNALRFGEGGTLWASTEGGLSRTRDGRVGTLSKRDGLPCDEVRRGCRPFRMVVNAMRIGARCKLRIRWLGRGIRVVGESSRFSIVLMER